MRRAWYRILTNFLVLLIIALCLFVVASCSTGGNSDNPNACLATHSYEYDVVGETGLTLKAMDGEFSYLTFEQMEEEYIDLEKCMVNTNTPGPNVEFINFDTTDRYAFPFKYALYYYAIQTAFIDTATEDRPVRNCISDREFLRHEYGHHVLYLNGLDDAHSNPLFEQCSALGPKTCNGEYCE